jgi:hypothetical protein
MMGLVDFVFGVCSPREFPSKLKEAPPNSLFHNILTFNSFACISFAQFPRIPMKMRNFGGGGRDIGAALPKAKVAHSRVGMLEE